MNKIRDPKEIAKWVNAYNNKRQTKNDSQCFLKIKKADGPFFISSGGISCTPTTGVTDIKYDVTSPTSTSDFLTIGPTKPTKPSQNLPDGISWNSTLVRYEAICTTCDTKSMVSDINFFSYQYHHCDTCLATIRYYNNPALKSS